TKTDADGLASFDISLERFFFGSYLLDFSVEGFESGGGRSVSAQNSVLLSPLTYLVGFKSDGKLDYISKDANRSVELIAITDALERQDKPGLKTILKEIQHVSTLVKQRNGTYKYQTVEREKERKTGVIDISKDGTRYVLPTSEPGDFVLEVYCESGIQLGRIKFSVVGHGNLAGKLEKSAELKLKLNKKDYKPGEVIEMNISAPYVGSGLITIESDRVHAYKWFSADTQST
ncbi:MAG: alpha-2-macroglobulin family protein, partial [bacterium]|nr:alpha-2-macroglobulin family protein [bacterium]